jgi:hypothetical protein
MNTLTALLILGVAVLAFSQAPPTAEQDFLQECLRHWHQLPDSWKLDDINNACQWEGINCDLRDEEYRITTMYVITTKQIIERQCVVD